MLPAMMTNLSAHIIYLPSMLQFVQNCHNGYASYLLLVLVFSALTCCLVEISIDPRLHAYPRDFLVTNIHCQGGTFKFCHPTYLLMKEGTRSLQFTPTAPGYIGQFVAESTTYSLHVLSQVLLHIIPIIH
jgi:hypothetical protein